MACSMVLSNVVKAVGMMDSNSMLFSIDAFSSWRRMENWKFSVGLSRSSQSKRDQTKTPISVGKSRSRDEKANVMACITWHQQCRRSIFTFTLQKSETKRSLLLLWQLKMDISALHDGINASCSIRWHPSSTIATDSIPTYIDTFHVSPPKRCCNNVRVNE